MHVLGISAFYHDSAACLLEDGEIVAAAQQERFSRRKHDPTFPGDAVRYCLREGGITSRDLACVAFYDKPVLKFERILKTYLSTSPKGLESFSQAMRLWLGSKLHLESLIRSQLAFEGPVLFPEHHESHAASAFFASPFDEAAFLTMDGVGEWATTSWGTGSGNAVRILADIRFPHSLGMLYSAFTYYTGFKVNSGEYKVMGLAPYGRSRFKDVILERLLDLKEDGSFALDMSYFDYAAGFTMTSPRFHELFGGLPRQPESLLTQREMDLAASVQAATEEVVLRMARHVATETGMRKLCLAGGVALNCVANGKLLREGTFEDLWIQPAAGDAGGALGAAYVAWHHYLQKPRESPRGSDAMKGALLGPSFSDREIRERLADVGWPCEVLAEDELAARVAELLAEENVVGWFQGRMEFGPRALGARSILGDARSARMQSVMNLKIKYRESFRPFAPVVLEEEVGRWFELDRPSPYMLLVADVVPGKRHATAPETEDLFGLDKLYVVRSEIPAVTHVDHSARIQTVGEEANPRYRALLRAFRDLTGCPVLVNTSFNVRGEPLVCTPEDAYRCFMRTEMDYLVLGNLLLDKRSQPELVETEDWRAEFALD